MHGNQEHWSIMWSCLSVLWTHQEKTGQCSWFLPLHQGSSTSLHLEEGAECKRSEQRWVLPIQSLWKHMQFEKMKWGSTCSTWSSQSQGAGLDGSGGRELREGSFCHTQQGNSAWEKQAYHTVCSQCCKQVPEAWWHKRKRKRCMVSAWLAPPPEQLWTQQHFTVCGGKNPKQCYGFHSTQLRVFLGNGISR